MTREEWSKAEPVLSQALLLPEHERKALIDTAFLEDALRRELLEALDRTSGIVTPASTGASGAAVVAAPPRLIALKPGDAVDSGRFVVIRQIGRGGMGSVYLAHDTMLGTLVALKALPFDERLLAEARRAAVCSDHPHVATVHNILRTEVGGEPVGLLVMEYVAGTPASRLLDDGPVEIARALQWGRQVAAAVAHAHDHQVLHCDLKPANIVITPDGRAKVLDFGIARATFDPINPSEPVRGTIPYMAPEQLAAGEFTQAGDIYSLGVTLFEMVSGRRPFEGPDAKLRMQILVAPPPALQELVAGVPPQLETILERAMAKDPDQRYRSARALERALEEIETGVRRTTTASVPVPATVSAPTALWSKIGIGLLSLVAAVAAITLLGAFTSATFNLTLERAGFANESVLDWLNWGLRASGGPFILLIGVVLVSGIARLVWRLAIRMLDRRGRLRSRVATGVLRVSERLDLDSSTGRSLAALLVSIIALAIAVFLNRDLFPPLLTFVANGPVEDLALLSPHHSGRHNAYRRTFALVIIIAAAAWYPVLKTRERRRGVPGWAVVGGVLTIAAALLLLHHPHRLLFFEFSGYGFEAVGWQENYCYVLGQRGSDTLLLCPEFAPPRHRIVRTGAPGIEPLGIRESVFRAFYRQAEGESQPGQP